MNAVPKARMRLAKFGMVGLLGAVMQVAVFDLLLHCAHFGSVAAAPLAVEAAILHNFFWHERFTWRDRESAGLRQRGIRLGRFHLANGLVSLASNTLLAWWLIEWLEVPAWPSQVLTIALCAPFNFLLADRWVYSGQPKAQSKSVL